MRQVAGHRFLVDDVDLLVGPHLDIRRVVTYRQVTDAHLLAIARRHGASLATFDRGLATLAGGSDVTLVSPSG